MVAILRFIGRRFTSGRATRHPMVRRVLVVVAIMRWIDKRFIARTQHITLNRDETLVVSVLKNPKAK